MASNSSSEIEAEVVFNVGILNSCARRHSFVLEINKVYAHCCQVCPIPLRNLSYKNTFNFLMSAMEHKTLTTPITIIVMFHFIT